MYLDITKFVLSLAAGSIVLPVGSLNFNQSNARSLRPFASPLFLVAMSIIFGVLFMILLALNYEDHLHHPNDPRSYTRFKYTRNRSLLFLYQLHLADRRRYQMSGSESVAHALGGYSQADCRKVTLAAIDSSRCVTLSVDFHRSEEDSSWYILNVLENLK